MRRARWAEQLVWALIVLPISACYSPSFHRQGRERDFVPVSAQTRPTPDAVSRQDLDNTIEQLEQQALTSESTEKLIQLGDLYLATNRKQGAIHVWRLASERDPKNIDLRVKLALEEFLTGQRSTSATHRLSVHLLHESPNHPSALYLKGVALQAQGKNTDARDCFEAAWQGRPPSVAAGVELAHWDWAREHRASAVDRLRLCIVYQPQNLALRVQRAEWLEQLGRQQEAEEERGWLAQAANADNTRAYGESQPLLSTGNSERRTHDIDSADDTDLPADLISRPRETEPRTSSNPKSKRGATYSPLLPP